MTKKKKLANESEKRFTGALDDESIPKLYFNGFAIKITPGDIQFVLEQNNKPVAHVNVSLSIAKTFARSLGGLIASLEEQSGETIMTHADLTKTLSGQISNDDVDSN